MNHPGNPMFSYRSRLRFPSHPRSLGARIPGALFFAFLGFMVLPASAADWTQWRGPDHDGVSRETGLLSSWPEGGPGLLWKTEDMGVGYSNISFAGNRIYSMGDNGDSCFLYAIDAKNGKGVWGLKVGQAGGNYKGPRCTPATDGKLVFALGQFGDFVCADAKNGKLLWKGNVEKELGGRVMSGWNFSMSPVIDGNQVVLPIGGDGGTVIALERSEKGPKILWRSKEITDAAAYTSLVPITLGGVRQYLLLTEHRLAGIAAKDGKLLWQIDCPGRTAVCSDPAFWMENDNTCYVFASCAYNVGARGFKLSADGGRFNVEEIYSDQKLQSHHGGIVQLGGNFYLLTQRELVCVDPKTGQTRWNNRSVGKGSIFSIDGKLIVRGEAGDGTVALVDVNPDAYVEHGRFDQPERTSANSWTYPIVFNGRLYLRDQHLLLCYEVK